MENPFTLTKNQLTELLRNFIKWYNSNPREAEYSVEMRQQAQKIRDEFLHEEVISSMPADVLYNKIFEYSRSLEGPAFIKLGEQRIKSSLDALRRNLLYIITSKDSPFEIAQNILEGEYKIDVFAKAFWSPILQARFPEVLPNWNNKTEAFMKKVGVNITTSKLSVAQKYKLLSNAFTYLSSLLEDQDFFDNNHLMHYGTVIGEGKDILNRMLNLTRDPVYELVKSYKRLIKTSKLEDELYKWELVKKYQGKLDPASPDFIQNLQTTDFKNLIYPIAITVKNHLARDVPDDYRNSFVDLFDDDTDVVIRVESFMENIERIYRKIEPKLPHHHDERTIATFLAYHNPSMYPFFKDSYYKKYCSLLGVEPEPKGKKYEHYIELVTDLVNKYIIPDMELTQKVSEYMNPECFEDENHLILAQDILFQLLEKNGKENDEQSESDVTNTDKEKPNPEMKVSSLNTILYGPPGTGKTYKINKEYFKDFTEERIQTKEDFCKEMVKELTWWEVIGVILLDLNHAKIDSIYNHELFQARIPYSNTKTPRNTLWARLQRHTLDDCPYVKISARSNPQFTWRDASGNWSARTDIIKDEAPQLFELLNTYKSFSSKGILKTRYVFTTFHQSFSYEDFIEGIKPVMTDENESIGDNELKYEIKDGVFKSIVKEAISDPDNDYAIFIDEINRGNIANIFGELITLIEEDKRIGKENYIPVTLPYSKIEFGVPPNLYLIGTMNTADRSVEALDTALRRRFSFIEMMPLYDLPGMDKAFAGVTISELLETINGRIEKLIDRDHMIGHSYFLGLNSTDDLMTVFRNKVIPLLQEYFYGNYEKMGLVLGKGLIEKLPEEKVRFASFPADENDFNEKVIYRIRTTALENPNEFTNAISLLMNK